MRCNVIAIQSVSLIEGVAADRKSSRVGPDRVLLRATPPVRASSELTLYFDHRLEEQTVWLALVLISESDRALERKPVDVFGHTEETSEVSSDPPENRQSRKNERAGQTHEQPSADADAASSLPSGSCACVRPRASP